MNDQTKTDNLAAAEKPRSAKNDGPDETPVYEDLYHDEGRTNPLEEEADGTGVKAGAKEKGDDL
ncbi:MAG: hypothetical protein ABIS50_07715 [Luteolibacter sp.]|uniref:hypothetical protein n=1 Tax=Luteolibacter sp. TaxID=1962973 RepID=UPI0032678385